MEKQYTTTLYTKCPLCGGKDLDHYASYDCRHHPMWKDGLPFAMSWLTCDNCNHIFATGYYEGEALEHLLSNVQDGQGVRISEQDRYFASLLIERLGIPSSHYISKWLDVGFGSGAMVMTANEFGYLATGLDLRPYNVEALNKLGLAAYCQTIEEHAEQVKSEMSSYNASPALYDVISMLEVLEHIPFPIPALKAAHSILAPHGTLIVSCPNMDTELWRAMDNANANPYWSEIEHCHNFTRRKLYHLLVEEGFKPISYHVSPRYKSCMEVIARKKS